MTNLVTPLDETRHETMELPTTAEWPHRVEDAVITAAPVRLPRKGTWWTWEVTINGVNGEDFLSVGAVRTKTAATEMVDEVVTDVRETLSDRENIRNHLDTLAWIARGSDLDNRPAYTPHALDPVVSAVLRGPE